MQVGGLYFISGWRRVKQRSKVYGLRYMVRTKNSVKDFTTPVMDFIKYYYRPVTNIFHGPE